METLSDRSKNATPLIAQEITSEIQLLYVVCFRAVQIVMQTNINGIMRAMRTVNI